LTVVLKALSEAGFSFNIKKCSFLRTEIEYLGYLVKDDSIEPNPRKIQALAGLSQPKNVSQFRKFIGLASYFRKFVLQFSEQMKPLYQLTSKISSFVWKTEHEEIRQKIISVRDPTPTFLYH